MTDFKKYNKWPEPEKQKLQKEFHDNDLNYLSSVAFENGSFSEADSNELTKLIDKRSGKSSFGSGLTIFLSLVCGIFIGITLFFVWDEKNKTNVSSSEIGNSQKLVSPVVMPTDAYFDSALANVINAPKKEHFNVSESGEQLNLLTPMENIDIKEINSINIKEQTLNSEEILNYIPNASVIFIHDLKVANYKNYYFKNNNNIDIRDNGVSAQFANKEEVKTNLNKRLEERDYYAHEIIKDAMQTFHKKQFTVCIDLLNFLYRYNKEDVNAQFYLGMSFYSLGDYNKAMSYFTKASDNKINIFLQEAEFYTALCYKNTNKITEANELFKQIIDKKMFYAERAKEESN